MDGTNWENVRADTYVSAGALEYLDLGKVRRAPFTVESCVWIQTHNPAQAGSGQTDGTDSQTLDTPTKILINVEKASKLEAHTAWDDVKLRTRWVDAPKRLPKAKSAYFSEDNRPMFKNGATLFPHCLMVIDASTLTIANDLVSFATTPSSKKPWSDKGSLSGSGVPIRWVRETVFSDSLFPFTLSRELDKIAAPLGEDGLYDEQAGDNAYWVNADSVYRDGRGRGGNTPKTLWGRLNLQNVLTRQTTAVVSDESSRKVIYNASGRIGIRAARMPPSVIASHSLYHLTCATESEAAYLVALLNADILQEAYRQSQKTRRHFDLHLWSAVPIPRYDSNDPDHVQLAALCRQAETTAQHIRDSLPPRTGQRKVSESIHEALRYNGIAVAIDQIARKLIPEQATDAASETDATTTPPLL